MSRAVHAAEREPNHLCRAASVGTLPITPPPQTRAQEVGLEVEPMADVEKRERPFGLVRGEPLFGLCEERLPSTIARRHELLKRPDCVLENRQHQPLLWLQRGVQLDAGEVLRGEDGLGLQIDTGTASRLLA